MRFATTLGALALGASSGIASAQPAEPAPPATPAPRDDAGWTLYHDAFRALARDDVARARTLVASLLREYPGHPAAALVGRSPLARPDAPARPVTESASRGARAELALFQTLHGIFVGVELCVVAECGEAGAVIALMLLGGGAGAVASLQVDELTSGQRALLNSGTAWGAVNAGLVLIAAEPDDAETIALGMLAGQGAGLLAGGLAGRARPTAGQVALANSGGQWAFVLTGLALAAIDSDDVGSKETALALLAATDAGLVAGGYLASRRPAVSRAQTLVIDAGGIAGAIAGGSAGVILSGDVADRTTPLLAAVGTVIGLGTAAYLTRDWGGEDPDDGTSPRAYVAPLGAGAGRGGVAGLAMRW